MNIEHEITRVKDLIVQAEAIKTRLQMAAKNTSNILQACSDLKVGLVGIGKRTDEFKDSKDYPFGPSGSVFADGREIEYYQVKGVRKQKKDTWPIAWAIARNAGVAAGCGNSGQHQVNGEFLDGVYRCKDGVWSKDD
ncbi:MAG: hypothetical protein U5N55_04830 [Cypionkella sp.]|nr:hypothetical protein [Cypionkella sp.]